MMEFLSWNRAVAMQKLCSLSTHGLNVCIFQKRPCSYIPLCHLSLVPSQSTYNRKHICMCKQFQNNDHPCQFQTFAVSYCVHNDIDKHMEVIESASTEDFDKQFAKTEHSQEIKQRLLTAGVVPGKGPPPEPPVDCCMSGCANCVWLAYVNDLKDYYDDEGDSVKLALELIENPSLKTFVKLELGLM